MGDVIYLKRGLNIRLLGTAAKTLIEAPGGEVSVKPRDFFDLKPKLTVNEGDHVKSGDPLFYHKGDERILFTSPVSGTVSAIIRGDKRVILEVRVKPDGRFESKDFSAADPEKTKIAAIKEKILVSGLWPNIRQRPFSIIAKPDDTPRSVYISAFDTAPLAPDYDFIASFHGQYFQRGIDVLARLTAGKVYLGLHKDLTQSTVYTDAKGVVKTWFMGPHPAGNVGVQIHHTEPLNKGECIWYVNPQGVMAIGKLFAEGKYDSSRIIALTGSEVITPSYYKVPQGADIASLLRDNIREGNLRIISGNVLTGSDVGKKGHLGFYDYQVSVIPEGDHYEFLGWAKPGLRKFSVSRTFFSWLARHKQYRLDSNFNGGHRAFVVTGLFERVLPMDIFPMHLIKAAMIKDIDLLENLGIYEVDEEDFALCEFVDPSKTEIQSVIREALDYVRKEMA